MRIIITGASGFIGTNVLSYYALRGHDVYNLDYQVPRNNDHKKYWKSVDICDFDSLNKVFMEIRPDFVIHLAARTDLNEKDGLDYYSANILGVENLVKLCGFDSGVKRVIFASSMLVNQVGYSPLDKFDYNPSTIYGQSKVMGEKIVFSNKESLTEFCIVRPTSIWGEWFSVPYKNFFDYVLSGMFFHPGKSSCTKTYGYIGNAVYQIDKFLFADAQKIDQKIFYIGDNPPINISDWANEIAEVASVSKPKSVPLLFFRLAGWFGDLLGLMGLRFPMTSFRVKNMTTDHIVSLQNTYTVCGVPPFSRREGTVRTVKWIK